jgi:hypothetical protein
MGEHQMARSVVLQRIQSADVVQRLTSGDIVQRVASADALQRLTDAAAARQRPRSGANSPLKTLGDTASEVTRVAREAWRRAIDDALRAALERQGFDDRKSAELDAAVRRLEEQQRQTLAMLVELRTAATPMPPASAPAEVTAPGPAGMAATELPDAAPASAPAPAAAPRPRRTATKRPPAKSTKVSAASSKTARATKSAKTSPPRKSAAAAPRPKAQSTRRSNNKAASEPTVVSRGRNNISAPTPDPEHAAPRGRRTRPLRARGR